ncbi:sugar phosphate nucleotidyltransferase [Jeotgalibacillus soli]|uniref:Putative glucose-1-phosphate thymidylyltransferase n=1 Tax=Jeotgalibacillus soli TaxID=889306 RepID=A0A0C2R4L0_9BACL|nr:sugar phosphate nucleotidyltransferase [Jeotgalibacillus soli]KIL45200.1 putative glucose-1-phosphate thymidylyltransferase [Jeotgalibacillus soli]
MKGIILCAGRGTRVQPFSYSLPKTLLPVMNRPLLDHGLEKMIAAGIREIGIVINPSQKVILEHIESNYPDGAIKVFVQNKPLGIAHALRSVQNFIGQESFLLLLGDNLLAEPFESLIEASNGNRSSILLKKVVNPEEFGVALIEQGKITGIEEKPTNPKSNLAVMGAYIFQAELFEAIHAIQPSDRGEYEITDAIQWLIDQGHDIAYIETHLPTFDVGTTERWLEANAWMMGAQSSEVSRGQNTRIEDCLFYGKVHIGDACILKNAIIGPNVTIQDGCFIQNCRIQNSIIMTNATIKSNYLIRNSIIGNAAVLKTEDSSDGVLTCMLGDQSIWSLNRQESSIFKQEG